MNLAFNIQSVSTSPTTITVPDDYPTIQKAINNAYEGDTIFVKAGTFYEHVVVNKTVSLIGENKSTTIVDGNGTDTGILITANQVTVQEFSIRRCEVGMKVESDDNNISSNLVSENGYYETELLPNQEIYQDYVSPIHRWYLHNMIEGNYTSYFNITDHTPAISVQALGQEDVNQLGIGLFHDENGDHEPQLQEYIGYMDAKEQDVHVFLVSPPVGQYIIKVLGWEVLGEPGHFDLEITRYTGYGIVFLSSENNIVTENLVTHNPVGLYLYDSHNTTVQLNDAVENVCGIALSDSTECVVSNNNASLNEFGSGIRQFGIGMTFWSVHDFFISENNLSSNLFGMWLFNSSDNEVVDNDVISNMGWSLLVYYSEDNTFQYNNISLTVDGVRMMFSDRNNFTENYFESNGHSGIFLWLNNTDNSITKNRFYSNQHGVELKLWCNNNTITDNDIRYNMQNGILILESTGNLVMRNCVLLNARGIISYDSSDNKIYHNNIIESWEQQAADFRSANIWDNDYPNGGNFWSDYMGDDLYSGPYQNEAGSDGFGDTPYFIEGGQDNYPLMKPYPWDPHDIGITSVECSRNASGWGYNVTINLMMFNYGNYSEIFDVRVYANETLIGEISSIELASRDFAIIPFVWNTSMLAKDNYTIKAIADTVLGEIDIEDNTFIDSWTLITRVGDLGGGLPPEYFNFDSKVDGMDLALFIQCYKSLAPPEAMYLADLGGGLPPEFFNCDGVVDGYDLALFIACYKGNGPDT
jgi:parallel beta-helix repeat protein